MSFKLKKSEFYCLIANSKGFTLVELAIVLVIFGLLLAALLTPLSAQREIKARGETLALLNQAKEALIGYALVNRHLPCPDTKLVPNGIESRGIGICTADEGVLPWATLGIEGVDAWNHYFRYRVDTTFSNSTNLFTIANAEGFSAIQVNGEAGISLVSANSRPVAVLVSHGLNGLGALNTGQTSPANQQPLPTAADEIHNANANTTFVSRSPSGQGSANEFDDMLVWISPKLLINRMVLAGRLP